MEATLSSLLELNRALEAGDTTPLTAAGGVDAVAASLNTSTTDGLGEPELTEQGVALRERLFGSNKLEEEESASFFALFWEALYGDLTMRILLVAATLSIAVGMVEDSELGWVEGAAIFLAVFIVALVTAGNDYVQERQFAALNEAKEAYDVNLIRNGVQTRALVFDVMVGDVVVLERDDAVPGDGILIQGDGLALDKSQLNGESIESHVTPDAPFLQSGAIVGQGFGSMLVTAVGENTLWGETLALLSKSGNNTKTPLQIKLHKLATRIGKAGLVFAIVVFIVLVLSFLIKESRSSEGLEADAETFEEILTFFIVAVTIVVVAVPEGLPLAVTISLAYSMSKMYRDNNLVRRLAACEIMGGVTQICSDKTGTLTQNHMAVVEGWFLDAYHPHDGAGPPLSRASFETGQTDPALVAEYLDLFCTGVAVNSSALLEPSPDGPEGSFSFIGSKTEGALLAFAQTQLGFPYEPAREAASYRKRYSFDPRKKRMSCILHRPNNSGFRLHIKGASEIVLGLAVSYLDHDATPRPLVPSKREELLSIIDTMASKGLRTLAVGYVDYTEDDPKWEDGEPSEPPVVLTALVGIADPVRPEVPGAVGECMDAGITVRMVTGDNLLTAVNIATQCGIFVEEQGDLAMEGSEFRELEAEELAEIMPRLRVIARCSPKDKTLLVNALMEAGEVTAVTGDGSNDSPALSAADVGLSMGIMGTRLAINASDIVILDDNFKSIVTAVMWGRGVFDNIRKFLQFQLTINVTALSVALVAALAQRGIPLKAIQLLWVNLIMDTMAALALGTEVPSRDLLKRAPYGRSVPLISKIMWRNIIGHSFVQLAILLTLLFAGETMLDLDIDNNDQDKIYLETLLFNIFVLMQVSNEIGSRAVNNELNIFKGISKSYIFMAVIAVTLILQFLIVTFGGRITHTTELSVVEWLVCIAIGLISIPVAFFLRFIPVGDSHSTAQSTRRSDRPAPMPITDAASDLAPVGLPDPSGIRRLQPTLLPDLPKPIAPPV